MAIDPRTGQTDVRDMLAQQLLSQGTQTGPVRHPLEGVARLAQSLSGALLARKAGEQRKTEAGDRNRALAEALQLSTGKPAETVDFEGGQSIDFQPQPANPNLAISNLLGNPNTADLPITQQLLAQKLAPTPQKFGQPVAGIGPGGEPEFRQFTPGGASQPVPGFTPPQKSPLVTVTNAGETAEAKELGKQRATKFGSLQSAAGAASGKLQLFDQIETGMEGFETGSFAETRLVFGRAADFFGVDPEQLGLGDTASGESIKAAANKLAQLSRAGSGEGTTLAGQMSDKDVEFLIASNASVGKTSRGNKLIMQFQRRGAERVIEKRDFFENWLNENGNLKGANSAWSKFERQNPLFTDEDRAALSASTRSPKQMSIEELTGLDVTTLSVDEIREAEARFKELSK
jgi:hypothetical protein